MQESVIRLEHITREFPGVLANDDVSLEIRRGEVFALVGENGAGKSTLMNIIYGIFPPTDGSVYIRGKKVETFSPKNSIEMGIGMVHQHFMLVPSFTVAQNIVMSREPRRAGIFFDNKRAEEITRELVDEYGLYVDPSAPVQDVSVGVQQRVEILKALYRGADILILDEPTAVLTPQETAELFRVIRHIIEEKNMTVILITHKLGEVMAISDRVGVMRAGRLVGVHDTRSVNERMLASMMVGREMLFSQLDRADTQGEAAIEVENLQVLDDRGLCAVNGISLSVRRGEILGVAAIEGNGQSELAEAICGLRPLRGGDIRVLGRSIRGQTPGQIRAIGLSHIPEDRLSTGVSTPASISDNLLAGKQRRREFALGGLHLRRRAIHAYAQKIFEKFDIRGAGVDAPAASLSGGNMQKVVVAREFSFDSPVLIVAQPSRGVDIGAMEFIHRCIIEKRNAGCAILLISADLDEVFRLSDRIVTLYEGRVTGRFPAGGIEKADIGYYMTGHRQQEASV